MAALNFLRELVLLWEGTWLGQSVVNEYAAMVITLLVSFIAPIFLFFFLLLLFLFAFFLEFFFFLFGILLFLLQGLASFLQGHGSLAEDLALKLVITLSL